MKFQLGRHLRLKTEFQNHEVPVALYPYIEAEELALFYQYKATYLKLQPQAKVTEILTDLWYIKDVSQSASSNAIKLSQDAIFPVFTTSLSLIPPPAYSAIVELKLKIRNWNIAIYNQEAIDFGITVHLKEPIIAVESIQFPPFPYNKSESTIDGFHVGVQENHVSGSEPHNLGIAIYGVHSEYGAWQYKKENDYKWKSLSFNTDNSDSNSDQLQVLHLGPRDSLKFILNADTFWSKEEAINTEKVIFRFWEMDVNAVTGL